MTVVRGPDTAGRWYWRARRAEVTLWAGWATREEAAAAGARLTLGQPAAGAGECRTVRDLLELWFGEQEQRVETGQLAASSLGTMRAVVRALLRELGPILLGALSLQTLERYRDTRLAPRAETLVRAKGQRGRVPRRASMAPWTVSRELRVLGAAWTWGHERGLVPTATLPQPDIRVRDVVHKHTPTAEEVAAVVAQLSGWPWLAVRLYWATGCRLGEIATLRRRDIDAGRAIVHVRAGPGSKTGARDVVVVPSVMAELLPYLPTDPDAPLLGVTYGSARTALRRYLADACRAAGVPRWTAQALRRFATDALYEAGADPGVEQAQIGHSARTALTHYRRARVGSQRRAVEAAGLGVLPQSGGDVVLLGQARREATERAIVEAAQRGDLVEVARLAATLDGTATARRAHK